MTSDAIKPKMTTDNNGVVQLFSHKQVTIEPDASTEINTGIRINPPPHSVLHVASPIMQDSTSLLQVKNDIITHGNSKSTTIHVTNNQQHPITISPGDCIAHLIHQKAKYVSQKISPAATQKISNYKKCTNSQPPLLAKNTPHMIEYNSDEIGTSYNSSIRNLTTAIEQPYQLEMSADPYDNVIQIILPPKGNHVTLGLHLQQNKEFGNRIQLKSCEKSTPSARIPRWRSTLRNAFLTKINDMEIQSIAQVKEIIAKARSFKENIKIHFATIDKIAMHPQKGIPLIYHDQLNIIAKHIAEIKINDEEANESH